MPSSSRSNLPIFGYSFLGMYCEMERLKTRKIILLHVFSIKTVSVHSYVFRPRRHCPSQAAGRHRELQPAKELPASLLQRRAGPPLELEPGSQPSQQGLLLTSCKDSIMRFWDASGVAPRPSRKLSTVGLFQTDSRQANSLAQAAEDDCTPHLPQERPLLTLQRRSLSQNGWLALQAGGWCRGSGMRLLGRWSARLAWTASRSGALSLASSSRAGSALVNQDSPCRLATRQVQPYGFGALGTSRGFGLFNLSPQEPWSDQRTLHSWSSKGRSPA